MGFDLFLVYLILIPLLFDFSFEVLYHLNTNIVWVCILFLFLSERLFQQDYEDGSFEWYWLSRCSLQLVLCGKLMHFWLTKCGGILLLFPLISTLYHLPSSIYLTVVLGSLALALVVSFYSCLTCGAESWSGLHHLITLPSILPIIVLWNTPIALMSLIVFFACLFWFFVLRTITSLLSK